MKPLTAEEILEQELEPVWRETDDSWRHGSYVSEVYERKEDGTFWMVNYRLSTDRETNELREGYADIGQCWPEKVETVRYTTKPV